MSQQFCLKWNNHMNNMMDVFKNLLSTEAMVDVTLACDGLSLKAHKIVLSACSPFFQSLFLENPCKHPIVILKDMKYTELKAIIEFMYHGEVNVAQDQLSALMKTAETLRVKGLAEVTNEKNSASSADESSHRTVPRTDTPPPKRRRGRTRKRSLSDQSDDEASEPKIKQPDSPEIEELSGDMDAPSSQYSNIPSSVPMQTVSSHSTNSFHKSQQQQEQPIDQGADESFPPEEKFGVEPSKLLEQTLTTDDLPRRSGRSSVQSNMSGMEIQRRPRSSTDHSTALVPASMPSDALVVANQQPESPPDIKPELLELDPPMSPVAGPSHSTDENSMMMYMDQSSMSALPGPSGYQDNSALVSTDSQPQENKDAYNQMKNACMHHNEMRNLQWYLPVSAFPVMPVASTSTQREVISPRLRSTEASQTVQYESEKYGFVMEPECTSTFTWLKPKREIENNTNGTNSSLSCENFSYDQSAKPFNRILHQHTSCDRDGRSFKCKGCGKSFMRKEHLEAHKRLHLGERPFDCNACEKRFKRKDHLDVHKRTHTGERPYNCKYCDRNFKQMNHLRKHTQTHSKEETHAFGHAPFSFK